MRPTVVGSTIFLWMVMSVGCAGSGATRGSEAGRTDRITQADIGETAYGDLYELILARRASWLRPRGQDSLNGRSSVVQVYRDDVRVGGIETLRYVHPMEIEYVRYFDPVQASSRWGFDHGSGAIYVVTRKD
jgi:hypothetical protein